MIRLIVWWAMIFFAIINCPNYDSVDCLVGYDFFYNH